MSLFDVYQQPVELVLRDYQEDSNNGLRDGFKDGHKSQMLYLSTGAGKSEIMIDIAKNAAKKGNLIGVISDRRILVNQLSERFDKYGVSHAVHMANHWRRDKHNLIQLCSAQTLEACGSIPDFNILLIDEAHRLRKSVKDYIENNPSVKVVGLSASPHTKGLGKIFSNVVSKITNAELVERKQLVPLRVFIAKEIDMAGAAKSMGEWSDEETTKRGIQITGDVVAEWVKKTHEIYGEPRKTIVFCAGVAHGLDLAEKFKLAGYNFVPLSYKDEDDFTEKTITEFKKPVGECSIHGLIATNKLTEGFDQSDVEIGVDARPLSKSFSSHVQKLGRPMRKHEGKEYAVWIDHAGNFLRFLDQWEDLYHNGVSALDDGAEKTKPEPKKEEKEAAKCPKCGELWGNTDVCQHCGERRVRRNTVVENAGTVEELGSSAKKSKTGIDKYDFYAELLGYAQEKGYKEGWAWHKCAAKFGTHPSHKVPPKPPSRETLSWITSQRIKDAYKKKFD